MDSGDAFYNKNNEPNKNFEDAYSVKYSEKSKRMMMNMGFKPGKGLGKFEHGRTQPVEASAQKGRRGLGAKPSAVGALPEDIKVVTEDSKPEAREQVVSLTKMILCDNFVCINSILKMLDLIFSYGLIQPQTNHYLVICWNNGYEEVPKRLLLMMKHILLTQLF